MPVINDRADRLLVVDKLLLKLGFGNKEVQVFSAFSNNLLTIFKNLDKI